MIHLDRTSHAGVRGASLEIGTLAVGLWWYARGHPVMGLANSPVTDAFARDQLEYKPYHTRKKCMVAGSTGGINEQSLN